MQQENLERPGGFAIQFQTGFGTSAARDMQFLFLILLINLLFSLFCSLKKILFSFCFF